jgi:hypothetical protein
MEFCVIVRSEVFTVVTMKIFPGCDTVYSGISLPTFRSDLLYIISVDLP